MKYFPRIHFIAARPRSPNISWAKWANQNNSKDESSSCRCSMTSYGDLKAMKRNVLLIAHLCFCSQKYFQQDDDQIRRKRTPSFPINESVLSRHAQKQRWEIIFSLLCRWDAIETVFRTIISVCRTRTRRPVVAEQSDPLFAPADLLIMTPTPLIEIPAQENLLQKHNHNQIN